MRLDTHVDTVILVKPFDAFLNTLGVTLLLLFWIIVIEGPLGVAVWVVLAVNRAEVGLAQIFISIHVFLAILLLIATLPNWLARGIIRRRLGRIAGAGIFFLTLSALCILASPAINARIYMTILAILAPTTVGLTLLGAVILPRTRKIIHEGYN